MLNFSYITNFSLTLKFPWRLVFFILFPFPPFLLLSFFLFLLSSLLFQSPDIRLRWLTYVEEHSIAFSHIEPKNDVLNTDPIDKYAEILASCITDVKHPEVSLKAIKYVEEYFSSWNIYFFFNQFASRVATLSYAWLLGAEDDFMKFIRPALYETFENTSSSTECRRAIMQAFVVIFTTESKTSVKEIDSIISTRIEPMIARTVDVIQGVVEGDGDQSDEAVKHLVAYLRAYNVLISFSSEQLRHASFPGFVHAYLFTLTMPLINIYLECMNIYLHF